MRLSQNKYIAIKMSKKQSSFRTFSEETTFAAHSNRIKTIENIVSMRYLTYVRYDDMIVVFYCETTS